MRVAVIGGTGHIGSYLVPRLVNAGHDVTVLARGTREPYRDDAAWQQVRRIEVDRHAEDSAGAFGNRIADLQADAVIDLVCFSLESAQHLTHALTGRTGHLLHCGTIWVHGPSVEIPVTEDAPRRPFGDYGTGKAAIESYLLRQSGLPTTILHPGHIVGPGWPPVNPAGNLDLDVFGQLSRGESITLPNLGMEMLHHVHADDVAQSFERALHQRSTSVGESFHVCSARSLSLRGYAEAVAGWFGQPARLDFSPYDEWKTTVAADAARATLDHIAHSPCVSIDKAARLLGYAPRYTSLQAIRESLAWLVAHDRVDTGGRSLTP